MTPKIKDLLDAMRSWLEVRTVLQASLDELVPPTTTGYLHAEQSWTIRWVQTGEYTVDLELAIAPPEGAHEWKYATVERLTELQNQLGCHRIHASPMVDGKTYYTAQWLKEEPKVDSDMVRFARHVLAWAKHGPGGTGAAGPCDVGCVKCRAEVELEQATGVRVPKDR